MTATMQPLNLLQPPSSTTPSLSSSVSTTSASSNLTMDSPRKIVPGYRLPVRQLSTHSDNGISYVPSHHGVTDSASPTAPLSIRNLTCHDHDTATPTSASSLSKHFGFPVLTIRKTSQAASTGSHAQVPRHHRRSNESPVVPNFMKAPHIAGECCQPPGGDFHPADESAVHDLHCDGDGEICSRHHHRQDELSTVSIACSDHDDAVCSTASFDIEHDHDWEDGIIMEPLAPSMLIPLVDRSDEMADLLEHPANKPWTKLVQNTIGMETYQQECLPLWIGTDRRHVPDLEWLRRSKKLLSEMGCGGISDSRLWNEFCGMVGWDAGDVSLDEPDMFNRRKNSYDSYGSNESAKIFSIAEEQEEEDEQFVNQPFVLGSLPRTIDDVVKDTEKLSVAE